MSWKYGINDEGLPIGYGVEAECDHEGCHAMIDRGLDFACGGEHGKTEHSCSGYFCPEHHCGAVDSDEIDGILCDSCEAKWIAEHPEEDD